MVTLTYSFRYLLRKKTRFITSAIIIAIVVGMYIGYSTSAYSYNEYLKKALQVNVGDADILITNSSGYMDISILEDIRVLEYVDAIDYYLTVYGKAIKDENVTIGALIGITDGFYWRTRLGDENTKINGSEVIITSDIALSLGLVNGDSFIYIAFVSNNYTMLNLTVKNVVQFKKLSGWETARLEIYANISYMWGKIPQLKNKISAVLIKVKDGYNITDVTNNLKAKFKGLIITPLKIEINVGLQQSTMGLLLTYLLAASILFLILVLYLNIEERRKEIGILKALGASNTQIFKALLMESLLYSLIGTIIGICLGFILALFFAERYAAMLKLMEQIPIIYRIEDIINGVIIGLIVPLFAMLISSIPAIKLKPVEVLRHVIEEPVGKLGKGLLITGIIFIILGFLSITFKPLEVAFWWARSAGLEIMLPIVFLYLFGDKIANVLEKIAGISGKLAPIYLRRKINRAVLMVILLGIALSFTQTTIISQKAFANLAIDTYNNKIAFDLSITFSERVPWNVSDELLSVEGVSDVLIVGTMVTVSGNNTVILAFVNFNKFSKFIGWKPIYGDITSAKENDTIVFEGGLKNFYKWLYKNKTSEAYGKEFNITAETGNVTLRIGVVLETTLTEFWVYAAGVNFGITMFLNESLAKKIFPTMYPIMVSGALVKIKEGYSADEVKNNIIKKFGKNSVYVMTKEEWYQESTRISEQIGAFFFMIGYMLYVVAIALIFVTFHKLFLIIRRELATLRSFGADGKSILYLFIIQAIITALLAVLAIAVDNYFTAQSFIRGLSLSMGVNFVVDYAWKELAILSVITTIVAILSAIPATIKAVKDNIASALRISE